MNQKTCTKCGVTHPATTEFFYKNSGGKFGVTPRCKPCVNKDNEAAHAARLARDPEKIRAQANVRTKRHYAKDPELSRKRAREAARRALADPVKREKLYARKRAGGAGLSIAQLEAIFESQEHKCAICNTQECHGISGSQGWNVDHCHTSGKVRFILCPSCNRGLGAFKDNPMAMRKAADLIEAFQNQKDKPVAAKEALEHGGLLWMRNHCVWW